MPCVHHNSDPVMVRTIGAACTADDFGIKVPGDAPGLTN